MSAAAVPPTASTTPHLVMVRNIRLRWAASSLMAGFPEVTHYAPGVPRLRFYITSKQNSAKFFSVPAGR